MTPEQSAKLFQAVHPGRHVHHAQARRHRPGPHHQQAPGGADGRPDLDRERGRRGQHVPVHRLAGPGLGQGTAARSCPSSCASCACWSWTTIRRRGKSWRMPLTGVAAQVEVVSSGAEAVAAVKQHDATSPYDLVFMDWRMPGMDGLQATRQIKEDAQLRKQPAIVMVTAFGREEVREEAERLGIDGFLRQAGHQVHAGGHAGQRCSRPPPARPRRPRRTIRRRGAAGGRADPAGRGQRDQPADRGGAARRRRRPHDGRQQRTRGRGAAAAATRPPTTWC